MGKSFERDEVVACKLYLTGMSRLVHFICYYLDQQFMHDNYCSDEQEFEKKKMLKIPKYFPSVIALPKSIYITDSYRRLAIMILENLQLQSSSSLAIAVTGTPGIGKSCFLPYLALVLNRKFCIVWQVKEDFVLCDTDQKCKMFEKSDMKRDDSIFLSDLNLQYSDVYLRFYFQCRVIFVSSPDVDKLKFRKKFLSHTIYYMPLWTAQEVMDYRKITGHSDLKVPLTFRFARWGGIARILFCDNQTYSDFCKEYERVLRDPNIIKKLCDRCDMNSELDDSESSVRVQWLSHMLPSHDFGCYIYAWPSVEVKFEVFQTVQSLPTQLTFRELLREVSSSLYLGDMYETAVKRRLLYGQKLSLKLYSLDDQETKPFNIVQSIVHVNFGSNLSDEVLENATKKLYIPSAKNQVSFDFVQPPCIFQITTAETHPVKEEGISKIIKCFGGNLDWVLVFLVPLSRKGLKRQRISGYPKMKQFKAFMDYAVNIPNDIEHEYTSLDDIEIFEQSSFFLILPLRLLYQDHIIMLKKEDIATGTVS